jgi:hypothetical protein
MNDAPALLPFADLPPKPSVPGRVRTGEGWRREDPATYEEVVERILGGEINVSKLAAEFAPLRRRADGVPFTPEAMRRAIRALILNDERLGSAKFDEIKKLSLSIVEAEMIDKVSELGHKATKADLLGAASMAMKMTRDTLNAQGGAPSIIIKHEHTVTLDSDTQRRREEARRRLEAQASELREECRVIEADVVETVEVTHD